jgi:hypothetical protein
MSSNPTMTGLLGHRVGVWLRNANLSSGSANDIWADRVQTVEPMGTSNSTDYYELGRVDKVGNTLDPTTFRVTLEENLHNSEIDMYLAGVNPTTGSGFWAGNIPTQSNTSYVVTRNDNDSVFGEIAMGNLRVSEIQYRFVMNGACTAQYTLEGTSGSYYTTANSFVHPLWGSQDNASTGGVHGKDARVVFGSTNVVGSKAYRLQSFTIRVQFPVQTVKELGNRAIVGQLVDAPNVTVEFDLDPGDSQPNDVFFPTSNDGGATKLVLNQPQTTNMFINLYDPSLAESASVLKSWKLENMRPTSSGPMTARVRALATSRWTLTNVSVTTTNSGGVIVSKTEITS